MSKLTDILKDAREAIERTLSGNNAEKGPRASSFVESALGEGQNSSQQETPVSSAPEAMGSAQPVQSESLRSNPVQAAESARPQSTVSETAKAEAKPTTIEQFLKSNVSRNEQQSQVGGSGQTEAGSSQTYEQPTVSESGYIAPERSMPQPQTSTPRQQSADLSVDESIQPAEPVGLQQEEINLTDAEIRAQTENDFYNAGIIEKPETSSVPSRLNRRFTASRDIWRERAKNLLSSMNKHKGMAFNGVLFSDPTLQPFCVSIGFDMVLDSIADPESGMLDLINLHLEQAAQRNLIPEEKWTAEEVLANPELLYSVISDINIRVTTEKSPVNQRNSVQVKSLRFHPGRGIGLHPTMAKAFNADFDADQMVVNADQANVKHYETSMTFLLDIEGAPAIDMDFFPIDPFDDVSSYHSRECISKLILTTEYMNGSSYKKFTEEDIEDILKGTWGPFVKMCDYSTGKYYEYAVGEFLEKLDGSLRQLRRDKQWDIPIDELVSYVFKAYYDFACLRHSWSIKSQIAESDKFIEMQEQCEYPLTVKLCDYVNEVVAGRAPYNFIEFSAFMSRSVGISEMKIGEKMTGNNVPFRMVADFCKAIHRTELITIGDPVLGIDLKKYGPDDPVPFDVIYAITCSAIETKILANRIFFGSHELAVSTQVKTLIRRQRQVALPDYSKCANQKEADEVFRAWLDQFIAFYNLYMRLLNASQVSFRNGGRFGSREKIKYDGISKFSDVGKALVEVYGDLKVSRVFPYSYTFPGSARQREHSDKERIWWGYKDMTIREFVAKNRLKWPTDGKKGIESRYKSGRIEARDVLMLVADRRTKQIGDYGKKWKKATEDNVRLFAEIAKHRNVKDFGKYLEEVVGIFHMMSAELFTSFGLDSFDAFMRSKNGKRLLNSSARGDVNAVRSELVSMMVSDRLNRISTMIAEKKELSEQIADTIDSSEILEQIETIDAAIELEYLKIGESSFVWHTIIEEAKGGADKSLFRSLIRSKGETRSFWEKWELKAEKFWKDEESEKYGTLLTFLKSEADFDTKMNVLCDLVRINEYYIDFNPADVIGSLACNLDSLQDGSSYDLDLGLKSDIDNLKASSDRVSYYRDSLPNKIAEEHEEFMQKVKEDKPAFESFLKRCATEPGFAVHVSMSLAADAMSTVFEPNMHDTEKIQQQATTNGWFENVSIQINGGFYTHLQQTDNKVVNVVGFDQVTFLDLLTILGDPSAELYLYDEFGAMTKEPLSRRTLCGGDTIDDVIRYLDENPRISCLVRRHVGGVDETVDGNARIHRMKYGSEEEFLDSSVDRVFGALTDRPEFFATVALITPAQQDVGRNMAERYRDNIEYVCAKIAELALDVRGENSEAEGTISLEQTVDSIFGLSTEKISKLLVNRPIEGIELTEEDKEEYDKDALDLYKMAHSELVSIIEEIAESSLELDYADIFYTQEKLNDAITGLQIDKTSVRACPAVLQQLSGSRTQKMISIEGSETKKNIIFKIWVRSLRDRFGMRYEDDFLPGTVEQLTIPEVPQDPTLNRNGKRQLTSAAKRLEVKRENAAETYNSKYKKLGDDGLNSIVKFRKYDAASIAKGKALRNKISQYNEDSRDEAIAILARALRDADVELGYKALDLSDYYNFADIMIGVNSDGSLVIRTFEQLSAAFNSRLSDDAIFALEEAETTEDRREAAIRQLAELDVIADVVGTDRDPLYRSDQDIIHDCFIDVMISGTSSKPDQIDRARRSRSSSVERTYTLLRDIVMKKKGNAYIFPPRRAIEKRAREVWRSLPKDTRDKLYGIGFPKSRWNNEKKKWESGNDWSKSYDLLGTSSDLVPSEAILVPGPQSLVLFSADPSENQSLFDRCMDLGITIAFVDAPPKQEYALDLFYTGTKQRDGVWLLPSFDMKLNGSFEDPIMPAPAQYKANPSNFVTCVKDISGEFGPSDAGFAATVELLKRVVFAFKGKEPEVFRPEKLFANIYSDPKYWNGLYSLSLKECTRDEVEKQIVVPLLEGRYEDIATIDCGVRKIDKEAHENAKKRLDLKLIEYARYFGASADDKSFLTDKEDCKYDSIIGFVKLEISGPDGIEYVFAPIVPFDKDRTGIRPEKYKPINPRIDSDSGAVVLDWQFTGDLVNQIIKIFEGFGSANKFMVGPNPARSRTLKSGWSLDGFYYQNAIKSRLSNSNIRLHTMRTVWLMAKLDPQFSYNFAMLPGSFPDNPEVKEALLNNTLSRLDWKKIRPTIKRFHIDTDEKGKTLDALTRYFVDRALEFETVNPSILLCSRTKDQLLEPWVTEFDAFLDTSYAFENAFLLWFNTMSPTLCPDSIEGNSEGCLFKPQVSKIDANDPYGTLLCLVPHWLSNGVKFEALEAVFISHSFFGEEYSGFKTTNANAKNRSIDSLNVASTLTPKEQSIMLEYGRSRMSGIPKGAGYMTVSKDSLPLATKDRWEEFLPEAESEPETNPGGIDPLTDGVDHVNIYSGSKTKLGKFLSNFAYLKSPIVTRYGEFYTLEGLWHFLGIPSGVVEREKLKKISGAKARSLGQSLKEEYGTVEREDFKDLIRMSIHRKLMANPEEWYNDENLGLPLRHYYVKKGKVDDQSEQYDWFIKMIEEEIEKCSKEISQAIQASIEQGSPKEDTEEETEFGNEESSVSAVSALKEMLKMNGIDEDEFIYELPIEYVDAPKEIFGNAIKDLVQAYYDGKVSGQLNDMINFLKESWGPYYNEYLKKNPWMKNLP